MKKIKRVKQKWTFIKFASMYNVSVMILRKNMASTLNALSPSLPVCLPEGSQLS